jgi:superfamily II DNA/RNA helicase
LKKRWGTASSSSSSQTSKSSSRRTGGNNNDDGADFVLSFGNDNDEYDDEEVGGGLNSLKGAAVFRSKRVVDPWAQEEGIYDNDDGGSNDDDWKKNQGRREEQQQQPQQKIGGNKRYNRQEAMLNRVRANQDRLQNRRSRRRGGGDDDDAADGNKTFNVPVDISRDYYDEDDEGYESRSGDYQRSNNKSRSSLVAPQPVGGRGSLKTTASSSSSASSLSGGIFSGRADDKFDRKGEGNRGTDQQDKMTEVKKQQKKERRKEPLSKPLLDEDGNEMFLTLEQADKIVQNILSVSSANGEEGDDTSSDEYSGSSSGVEWEDIGITDPTLLSNLQSSQMSCLSPLPVQEKACPPILVGNDVLVSTHTGSGKTLSFLAPIAQSLLMDTNNIKGTSSFPKAIIVAPGRELASQIVSVGQSLFAGTDLTISLAIGGTPFSRNVENLRKRKPDIVVGTPGRIAELVLGRPGEKGGKMKISGVQTIVLDEFDALLQYDVHKEPTIAVMEAMNRQHGDSLQRILCSATASDMMGETSGGNNVEAYLRPGYAHASVDESDLLVTAGVTSKEKGQIKTSPRVSRTTIHGALHVPHKRFALDAVRKVLNTDPLPQQALIFVDSPRRVDIVIEKLAKMDIIAAPLHGGASSGKGDRAEVNKALREGYVGCVVCTEIAARGIDAPYLTHVINLDLPTDASHYAHRAGRCGRGGRPGVSVSITCDGREKGVPRRLAEELGITMYNVEARGGKLRIVE